MRRPTKSQLWTGYADSRDLFGRVVDGQGVYLVLEDGRRVLDGCNTGAPLGHRHPEIVEAMQLAANAPAVPEAWSWVDRERAMEDLREIGFKGDEEWFGGLRFCLSGSEANDQALSLAQAITGRSALATRERAYHGAVGLARDTTVQPQWHGGLSWDSGRVDAVPRTARVVELPGPMGARIGGKRPVPQADIQRLANAEDLLADVAAVITDYTQGGIYHSSPYQDRLASAAANTGTLWIADEVVTGFGRTGTWFSFQDGESRPDLVTLGKGLGAGAAPAGAVMVSRRLAERLEGATWQSVATFRGHPITVAAVRAHLRVLARDKLVERVRMLDGLMFELMSELAASHPSVQRIDGRGLHWTVELHGPNWRSWRADTAEAPLATRVALRALEAGALIQTSGEQASLVLAPPFIIDEVDLRRLASALDHGLTIADQEFEPITKCRWPVDVLEPRSQKLSRPH